MKNKKTVISYSFYALLCLVRFTLTLIIAIPCFFLVLPFWLLGISDPWGKMSVLFSQLAFDIQT